MAHQCCCVTQGTILLEKVLLFKKKVHATFLFSQSTRHTYWGLSADPKERITTEHFINASLKSLSTSKLFRIALLYTTLDIFDPYSK